MRNLRSFSLSTLAVAMLGSAALLGSTALTAQTASPSVRIVSRIDESQLVTLKGNTHPAANAKNDLGPVSSNLPMTDLILVLSRSSEQQAAFDAYVASEYDQNSPNFHHWLTPDQVGAQFGASDTDIATISNWLTGHGFTVDEVTKDHLSIRFSGTAGLVQSAFHTEIHNLSVKGVAHIGNMTDPQIPTALAPAVVGIKALHNFFPKPLHRMGSTVQRDTSTGQWKRLTSAATAGSTASPINSGARSLAAAKPSGTASPQYGINGTNDSYPYLVEDVDPWDFATIYNILPLWNSGTPIDGTGQTIAIAGTSDIDVGQSSASETGANGNNDVFTFRHYFGLPTTNAANTPIRISGNGQPLTVCTDTTGDIPYPSNPCGIGDLTENSLDVEWSGSIAKNAQIILVSSYPASVSDDNLYDSESYIVNHLTARIMNVSYGECELGNGTAGNVEYYNLWQQAAAEGISVFVASGDSGSASCDDGDYYAVSGLTVNGLASTPWNTAVGGTDFNWCDPDTADGSGTSSCTASPYWSSSAITSPGSAQPVTTALGYVPETPWNESCANPLTLKWVQDVANYFFGYTAAQISNTEQSCNFLYDDYGNQYEGLYAEYPYITYLLETVGGSGGASGCVAGSAVTNSNTDEMTGCTTGATSTGTTTNPDPPYNAQASLTLVNNGWPKPSWQTGVSGIPSDGVRDLPDVSFFASDGYVSSSAYLICVSAATSNTPCTYSSYSEPFYQEVGGTSVATPAMAGVMALINEKTGAAQGLANPELYKLAASQNYGACSAESVTAGSTSCMFNDIDAGPAPSTPYTNAMPCDASDTTPNCTASFSTLGYADTTGLGILTGYSAATGYDLATGLGSLNVANVVNNWVSAFGSGATTVAVTPTPTTIPVGQSLSVTVTVASNSAGSTPTGSVILTGGGYTSAVETLSSGSYIFTIPSGSLSGGTDTLTVSYSGDSNYAPSSGTATVTAMVQSTYSLSATTPSTVAPGASTTSTVSVSSTNNFSGTVSFTSADCVLTGYPTGITSATPGNPTCALTGNGVVTMTNGAASSSVTYTVSTSSTTTGSIADRPVIGRNGPSIQVAKVFSPSGRYAPRSSHTGWFGAAGSAALAALFLFIVPGGARRWRQMLSVLLLMAAGTFALVGCGGNSVNSGTTGALPTPTVTVTPSITSTSVTGSQFTVTVAVAGSAGTPTGGVTLTGGGYNSGAGSGALASGSTSFTINPSSFTSTGTVTLTASYGGSSAYNSSTGTATITVNGAATTAGGYTFTVTPTSSPAFAQQPSTTFTVTVN